MTCDDLAPLLAARPLGLLAPDDARGLEAHLAACARCRGLAGAVEPPEPAPPADGWARLQAALAAPAAPHASSDPADPGERPATGASPATGSRRSAEVASSVKLACTFCHDGLVKGDAVHCASCLAPHHLDCFREHRGCGAAGCGGTEVVRATRPELLDRPRRGWRPSRFAPRLPVLVGVAACTWGLAALDLARTARHADALRQALGAQHQALRAAAARWELAEHGAERLASIQPRVAATRAALVGRTAPLDVLQALGQALPAAPALRPPLPFDAHLAGDPHTRLARELRAQELERVWLLGLRILRATDGRHEVTVTAAAALPSEQAGAPHEVRERLTAELLAPLRARLAGRLGRDDLRAGAPTALFQLHARATSKVEPEELRCAAVSIEGVVGPGEVP